MSVIDKNHLADIISGSAIEWKGKTGWSDHVAEAVIAAIEAEKPSEDAQKTAKLAIEAYINYGKEQKDLPLFFDALGVSATLIQSFADAQVTKERELVERLYAALREARECLAVQQDPCVLRKAISWIDEAVAKYQEDGE